MPGTVMNKRTWLSLRASIKTSRSRVAICRTISLRVSSNGRTATARKGFPPTSSWKMQINKSDRNDAFGIARIMQCGWYKEVRVKGLDSHAMRALLESRALLVKMKRDLENQIRELLKNLGLIIATARGQAFHARVQELVAGKPFLAVAVLPLLETRNEIVRQIATLDREVLMLARNDSQVRLFMTVPGIGPIPALCYRATIDEPSRFKRSRSVGAYVGLTTRRYASGEVDWTGRISKCGDAMLRSYLFEAAGVLLTRVQKWCALKAWGMRLAKRGGLRKAKVAVARKLAVILHRMWIDGTEFQWSADKVVAYRRVPAQRAGQMSLPGRWRWRDRPILRKAQFGQH